MRDERRVKINLSLSFEEVDDNGTVVRRSTERFGVTHTATITEATLTRYPDMPSHMIAQKMGISMRDAVLEVLPAFLDGKTGQAFCPSTIHEGKEIPAPVGGLFINHWNPARNNRVWYCEECAAMGELTGMFERDKGAANGN
ncbi:hypothetical protein SEA_LYMARA_83 [Arthrobacter phage Lymara]|uniref:Uncharacterized protein n=1 Tax=Arthrobacter phage Lymara TaxID=2599828 RepID=A0A5J6TXW0_9CAUD|nr:hypothetical protein HYQ01_gp083 [Arthrobacter phage Lymara]QFG14884.1 hypothetical protein SEA_LYMARA_83 [Arthrobacter phage Lymara]